MFTPLQHNLCPLVARPAPFTPEQIAGLKLWLKADSLSALADADPVAAWGDSSGNGNDATASGTGRPTFRLNVVGGAPVVRFDGADDRMALPNVLSGASAATAVFACKLVNDPPLANLRTGPPLADFGGHADAADHYPWTDGVVYHDFGSTARKTAGDPLPSLASWHVTAFRSAANDWTLHLNGSLLFGTSTNSVSFGAAPGLGASEGNGGPFFFDGDLAEVVVYDTALADEDRRRVERYLAGKYGIALS